MTSVRLSVCLSVCNVGDRIGRFHGYLRAEADPDRNRISHSANRIVPSAGAYSYRNRGNARNRVRNPSNSALSIATNVSHVALSWHMLSFLFVFTNIIHIRLSQRYALVCRRVYTKHLQILQVKH